MIVSMYTVLIGIELVINDYINSKTTISIVLHFRKQNHFFYLQNPLAKIDWDIEHNITSLYRD